MPALLLFAVLQSSLTPPAPAWLKALLLLVLPAAAWRLRCAKTPEVLMLLDSRRVAWSAAGVRCESAAELDERWPWLVVRALPRGPAWVFWPDTMDAPRRRTLRRWARAAASSPLPQFWVG